MTLLDCAEFWTLDQHVHRQNLPNFETRREISANHEWPNQPWSISSSMTGIDLAYGSHGLSRDLVWLLSAAGRKLSCPRVAWAEQLCWRFESEGMSHFPLIGWRVLASSGGISTPSKVFKVLTFALFACAQLCKVYPENNAILHDFEQNTGTELVKIAKGKRKHQSRARDEKLRNQAWQLTRIALTLWVKLSSISIKNYHRYVQISMIWTCSKSTICRRCWRLSELLMRGKLIKYLQDIKIVNVSGQKPSSRRPVSLWLSSTWQNRSNCHSRGEHLSSAVPIDSKINHFQGHHA